MAKSTGPTLAIAGVALLTDNVLFGSNDIDFKVIAATGFSAIALAMIEKMNEPLAVGIAWIALVTTILLRESPGGGTMFQHLESLLQGDWRGKTKW